MYLKSEVNRVKRNGSTCATDHRVRLTVLQADILGTASEVDLNLTV